MSVKRSLGLEYNLSVWDGTQNSFCVANRWFSLSFSFFAAETLMDTRVATAELGWTAYPNSGVSPLLPTHVYIIK